MTFKRFFSVLLVLAVVILAFLGTRALLDTSNRAEHNSKILREICEREDEQNMKQRDLWNFVIDLTAKFPVPDQTPEEIERSKKVTALFVTELNRTFPDLNCNEIKEK